MHRDRHESGRRGAMQRWHHAPTHPTGRLSTCPHLAIVAGRVLQGLAAAGAQRVERGVVRRAQHGRCGARGSSGKGMKQATGQWQWERRRRRLGQGAAARTGSQQAQARLSVAFPLPSCTHRRSPGRRGGQERAGAPKTSSCFSPAGSGGSRSLPGRVHCKRISTGHYRPLCSKAGHTVTKVLTC